MRVLVTRAEPAASKTAKKLKEASLEPIVFPLFAISDTQRNVTDLQYDGTIFTSSNAVSVMAKRGWRPGKTNTHAYCVGEKTANAAKKLGFKNVISADGGGRTLSKLILEQNNIQNASLLYPAPAQRAFDMSAALRSQNINVELCEIYEHQEIQPEPKSLETIKDQIQDGCVTAYSERSAAHTANVLFNANQNIVDFHPVLVAISDNTAKSVLKYPWQNVYVADSPTEAAMIEKIQNLTLRKVC